MITRPASRLTTIFRRGSSQLLLAAIIGAALGLIGFLDQQLMGGHEAASAIADILPARGFLWNVAGGAVLGVVVTLIGQACWILGEVRHSWLRPREEPRPPTPEEARAALRLIK